MTHLLVTAAIGSGFAGVSPALAAPPKVPEELHYAEPSSVGFSKERLAALGTAMQDQVNAGRFAGLVTLVMRHGQIVDFRTIGVQDLATGVPMRKDTIFRINSMTKPITAVALMILYEEGRWQLDDPVSKFIPEFKSLKVLAPSGQLVAQRHEMTMRELLTSTGGIGGTSVPLPASRNPLAAKMYDAANLRGGTTSDMIRRFANVPLGFQPGTEFEYAMSQDVQGAVIERISGKSLDVFFKTRIFDPLMMSDTAFGVPPEKRGRLASVYDYDASGRLKPSTYLDQKSLTGEQPVFLSAGGGLYSTARDYSRFATMLASGGRLGSTRVLSPSSVKLMTSNLLPEGVKIDFLEKMNGLGYGVDVGIIEDPGHASYNSGAFGKGTYFWTGVLGSWWWNDPVNDVTVIGLVQQEFAAFPHFGVPAAAPNIRAQAASIIYAALVEPDR